MSIRTRLARVRPKALRGIVVYRVADVQYRGKMDSTQGSFEHGGRFNPREVFGALYCAQNPELAWRERIKWVRGHRAILVPQVLATIRAKLSRVLDLGDPRVRKTLGVTEPELTHSSDYSVTQRIGAAAYRARYQAIRFPSSLAGGWNLAVFPDKVEPPAWINVARVRRYRNRP